MMGGIDPIKVDNADLEMTEDRLLVCPAVGAKQTAGGILLPESARGKPTRGQVIAVGPGRTSPEGKTITMPYKEGQEVVYGTYSGTEVLLDGVLHLILKTSDIYSIVHPRPEPEPAEEPEGKILLVEVEGA